jgi:hypothetical protein
MLSHFLLAALVITLQKQLPSFHPSFARKAGQSTKFLYAYGHNSACQEKYLWELSVTPVGAKSLLWAWGDPHGLFCMVKMRYFRATGMIFPRLPLLYMEFEGIWGQYFAIESE